MQARQGATGEGMYEAAKQQADNKEGEAQHQPAQADEALLTDEKCHIAQLAAEYELRGRAF
jgi:hypothetical protein